MKFNSAKGHLWGLDKKTRLRYYRSNQEVNKWLTAYDMPTLGIRVTLVENRSSKPKGILSRLTYELAEVRVESLEDKKGAQGVS